jgi:hypothetical protein
MPNIPRESREHIISYVLVITLWGDSKWYGPRSNCFGIDLANESNTVVVERMLVLALQSSVKGYPE